MTKKQTIHMPPYGEIALEDGENKAIMELELYTRAVLTNPIPAAAIVLDALDRYQEEITIDDDLYASLLAVVGRLAANEKVKFGETLPGAFDRPELVQDAMQNYLEHVLASIRTGSSILQALSWR